MPHHQGNYLLYWSWLSFPHLFKALFSLSNVSVWLSLFHMEINLFIDCRASVCSSEEFIFSMSCPFSNSHLNYHHIQLHGMEWQIEFQLTPLCLLSRECAESEPGNNNVQVFWISIEVCRTYIHVRWTTFKTISYAKHMTNLLCSFRCVF